MFGKLFNKQKTETETRILDHPSKLNINDALLIGFDKREEISNKEFFVKKVTGLDMDPGDGYERRTLHLGETESNFPLSLWIDSTNGADRLAFALEVPQPIVETSINIDQFVELFEPQRDHLVSIQSKNSPPIISHWLDEKYTEDTRKEIYWLNQDPFKTEASGSVSNNETPCDYYRLTNNTRDSAIEVFVFEGGKTDVYFINFLPLHTIEELMPGKQT